MSSKWQVAFLAMSAALGEPIDEAASALGDAGAIEAEQLARTLRGGGSSRARAAAIARVLAAIARDVEAMRIAC
jgi:hypothetical protein